MVKLKEVSTMFRSRVLHHKMFKVISNEQNSTTNDDTDCSARTRETYTSYIIHDIENPKRSLRNSSIYRHIHLQ